ncbi:MAG: ThuA domain-containing protein [Anaerolineales bacterium]|nr:ThuA domain-containing protein [Anaerolineales bacterium]
MSKDILLVSAGTVHPSLAARRVFKRTLTALPEFKFTQIKHLNMLPTLDLDTYAGMVLYYHAEELRQDALQAFRDYVVGGGGVLAVHSASASFKGMDKYYEVLGGEFVSHGPVEEFELIPGSAMDDIFGRGERFTIYDELYRHEYDPDNMIHYHVEVKTEAGEIEKEPFVWTRAFGQGRICYCAFGHTVKALQQPGAQAILRRGLRWVSGS